MKIYVVENTLNNEICELLKLNNRMLEFNVNKLSTCKVVIVSKVKNNKEALNIVDIALQLGLDILCVKPKKCREDFICNLLIKEGARYI